MSSPLPPPVGPSPTATERANLLSFLGAARTLTKIWVLLGLLVGLLNVLAIVFAILALRFPGGGVGGLVYAVLWVGVDLILLDRMADWSRLVTESRFQSMKESLLVWGVLSLIFGVVPGILVLLAYVRVLPWSDPSGPGGYPEPPAGASGGDSAPPSVPPSISPIGPPRPP